MHVVDKNLHDHYNHKTYDFETLYWIESYLPKTKTGKLLEKGYKSVEIQYCDWFQNKIEHEL